MNGKVPRWNSPCDAFQSPVHLPESWFGVEPRRPNWREDLVCERCGWPKSAHELHAIAREPESPKQHVTHHH